MADHLQLPPAFTLPTKRVNRNYNPDQQPPNRGHKATTLRGILAGLERSGWVPPVGIVDDDGGDAYEDDYEVGDLVLKFTGSAPFENSAFASLGLVPLATTDDRKYFALTDVDARRALQTLVGQYVDQEYSIDDIKDALRAELEKVEGIELYGRDDRIAPGLQAPEVGALLEVDLVIWPTSLALRSDNKRGRERVASVVGEIREHTQRNPQVKVLAANDQYPDRLLVHAIVDQAAFDAIAEHHHVERIRGALTARVTQQTLAEAPRPTQPLLPEGEPIGIIDDLVVDANPWLEGVVVEQRSFPSPDVLGEPTRHGTQVASVAAWGNVHELLNTAFDGQPLPLYVARVAQANDRGEAQVYGNPADQFAAALDWLAENGVRIVVIALGESHADSGPLTSDLSATLDAKALEHDLVIVTSAGNIPHATYADIADYPEYLKADDAKVAAPGTSALAVTVTAHAANDAVDTIRTPGGQAIARSGQHAPYARTGPVRSARSAGRQKPEFTADGGNWAHDRATGNLVRGLPELAVTTLIPPVNGRFFGSATGTSMAAPKVAHEIARIASRYPDASSNLLRALIALSGRRRLYDEVTPPPFHASTYGEPFAEDVLESTPNRVFFTYEGTMPTNRHIVLELPIPELFAAGRSTREFTIALAFDPPTRRSRKDYIAGRMEFSFLPNETMENIAAAFAAQPTAAERGGEPILPNLPGRRMLPTKTTFRSDTLVRRTFYSEDGGWDPDDEHYYLAITHDHSRWTSTQKSKYERQRFAVAVEMRDHDRLDIDLYAQAQIRLQAQLDARIRGRA